MALIKVSVNIAVNRYHATLKLLMQTSLFHFYRKVTSDNLTLNNVKPFN